MNDPHDPVPDDMRPRAPKIDGLDAQQKTHGRRLALIHDMHLRQLAAVRNVMEQVAAGQASTKRLNEAVSSIQMTHNYRQFGALCGQECAVLTSHHTIEDESIFPALSGCDEGLQSVIERLIVEHGVIHELLEQLQAAARQLVDRPADEAFARVQKHFSRIESAVRSHFGYEQEELADALGYWNIAV